MSSSDENRQQDEVAQKQEAIVTLGRIYRATKPQIHLQSGFSDEEIHAAIAKISNGLNLLLSLCKLELSETEYIQETNHLISNSYGTFKQLEFADGGSLGLLISEDALNLLHNLKVTNRYEEFEFEDLVSNLYSYWKICIQTNSGVGDMYKRIGDSLFIASTMDESYELEITHDLVREALNGESTLRRWLLWVLEELDESTNSDISKENKVAVVRFFDSDYVVAYATNDFVTFDELDFNLEKKKRYSDEFVHGEVYRNDKIFPDNSQDWLNLVLPGTDECFILGRRFYDSMEEAEETEQTFLKWLQALLDD